MQARGSIDLAAIPACPGAYVMLDRDGRPLYVGRAGDLRQRVRSYWQPSLRRPGLRGMVRRVCRVLTVTASSEHEAAFIERALLERHDPPFNRTLGFESIVAIRWTDTGLTTVHEFGHETGARYFGPYLGWSPVLAAQRALARAFPVHLCRAAAELSSVERDLARRRGIDEASRASIRERLLAALARDATAIEDVVSQTVAARDHASELGLYEKAAELHAETLGLRWIAQPQSVATFDAVGGWSVAASVLPAL